LDYLKIDRSFVSGRGETRESNVLLSAIINLTHSLGIKTIAEGVETETQLAELGRMGCDIAQGYYFAKPRPSNEVSTLLANHPR
jgi:EAL domain-containing protein (putative c-di-GMP-specific phosphodiesterase class I)